MAIPLSGKAILGRLRVVRPSHLRIYRNHQIRCTAFVLGSASRYTYSYMLRSTKFRLRFILILFGLFAVFAGSRPAAAQSVVQSYGSDTTLQAGLLVKLKDSDSSKVEPVTQTTINKLFGVVVSANAAPVTLSSGAKGPQAFVATSGTYAVLVSTQNGAIKPGDYLTVSSLDGVGMKADSHEQLIVGKAAGSFDGTSNVTDTTTLKNSDNQQISVAIGQVPVAIDIGRNPLLQTTVANLPGFLQRASQSIANKPVNSIRVYLSLVVLAISALIAGSLLYGGVRSGVAAIGRNPLSKRSIVRSLVQVTLTSLIIFIIGLFAVYLLLKL